MCAALVVGMVITEGNVNIIKTHQISDAHQLRDTARFSGTALQIDIRGQLLFVQRKLRRPPSVEG